ncbi:hypothetical protein [Stenotrophomonas sp. MMGLT7]|uniref:hypothetical protein n=1 Tax=Stenotrophomonas sp. MMGLT7 TaxID=2901227 RepID=UPI001E5D0A4E|nr:hypothetical protein [Stenotrophomonas sp. MMGLT7]MCD7097818.1 hypothetical protein [Stenotrophomonas sp. MMGLT7]
MNIRAWGACGIVLALAGCATTPMVPSVRVMPAPNQPFQAFQADDATCRQYAAGSVRGMTDQANNRAVGSAALGTVLGAAVGAALGGGPGPHHDGGLVAVGAVTGGAIGASNGSAGPGNSQYGIQQAYDNAYAQCMYSRGNQVPGVAMPAPQG